MWYESPPPPYEYLVVMLDRYGAIERTRQLNVAANDGWDLIQIVWDIGLDRSVAYFQRSKALE